MKYFRHLTTGRNGDRLKPIYAEFGKAKGYGLYFLVLELCAEKYNGKQEVFRFLEKELRNELELSKKFLETLLKLLKKYELVSDYVFTENGRVIELTVPDLIEISDDYSKKVRHKSDQNPSDVFPKKKKEIKSEIRKENIEVEEETPAAIFLTNKYFKRISPDTIALILSAYPIEFIKQVIVGASAFLDKNHHRYINNEDSFLTNQLRSSWEYRENRIQKNSPSTEPSKAWLDNLSDDPNPGGGAA